VRRLRNLAIMAIALMLAMSAQALAAPPGETISNVLEAQVTASEEEATISISGLDVAPVVTQVDGFVVATTAGSHAGSMVRVKATASPSDGFLVEYYEVQDDQWYPLQFDGSGVAWYGPPQGFPLADTDSSFRVTWNKMGTYHFNLEVVRLEDQAVLASVEQAVSVGPVLTLSWDPAPPVQATVNQVFNVEVTASKDPKVIEVNDVLYVIEVTKGDNPATPADIEAETTEGVKLGYDEAGGFFYYGPRSGFTFSEATVTTGFQVKVKKAGTYGVKVYAVKL